MKLTLYRLPSNEFGTLGVLYDGPVWLCLTLEDPWNDNKAGISCIPAGTYQCAPHNGAKYKNVWKLKNVPGRSDIVIHAGNTHLNTRGCILVGKTVGQLDHIPAILESKNAIKELGKILPKNFTLTIKNFSPQVFVNPPKLSWFERIFNGNT